MTKPNPEYCKNCSSKCACNCAQLQYTIQQHRTVLIISPHLQANIIAQMLTVGGEGDCRTEGRSAPLLISASHVISVIPVHLVNLILCVQTTKQYHTTRLPSDLRQSTRECMHLVRRGHFRSRDKDGGHIIIIHLAENPTLHANYLR